MLVFCLNTPFLCPGLPLYNAPAPVMCPGLSWQTRPFFSMPSLWQTAVMSGSGQLNGHITPSVLGHLGTGQSLQTWYLVLYVQCGGAI